MAIAGGAVICVSAGNQRTDYPQYPAGLNIPGLISVGASDRNDQRVNNTRWGSNFGNWVDIFAPGETIYTTYIKGWYAISGGTSLSAPVITGVAGVIKKTAE